MEGIKHIDTDVQIVSGDAGVEVKQLLAKLFPTWKQNDIKFQRLSGGFVNIVFKAWNTEEAADGDIIIRVVNKIVDLSHLVRCMFVAERGGCGAEILATFTNGLVYRCFQGEVLDPTKYDGDHIRGLVAERLAEFHALDTSLLTKQETPMFVQELDKALETLPDTLGSGDLFLSHDECFASKAAFCTEVQFLKEEISKLEYGLVFSPGDVWWGNIIYNEASGTVNLIDYDFAGYNHPLIDIAIFLGTARFNYKHTKVDYLSEEEEKSFIRAYLRKKKAISNHALSQQEEDIQMESIYKQCCLFKPFVRLIIMTLQIRYYLRTESADMLAWTRLSGPSSYIKEKRHYLEILARKAS